MGLAANYGVAHVYFNFTDQENQQAVHVLTSLVKQLAYNKPQLPATIAKLYDKLKLGGKTPTLEQLYTALLSIIKLYHRIFFIFDALDECEQNSQRPEILLLVHRMKEDGIRIFITSREYQDIQDSFRNMPKIELLANGDDIRNYILEKINGNARAKRLIQRGKFEDRIISELISCSEGM